MFFSCQYYILLEISEVLKLQLRICLACSIFNLYHNCYKASGFTFFIFYFKGREFCAGQTKVCSTHWPHEGWSGVLLQHVGSNSHGVRSQAGGQNLSTHLLEIFDPSILILCEWTNGVEWKTHQIVRHEVVVLCQWLKYCSYLCASHTNPVGDMGALVFSISSLQSAHLSGWQRELCTQWVMCSSRRHFQWLL